MAIDSGLLIACDMAGLEQELSAAVPSGATLEQRAQLVKRLLNCSAGVEDGQGTFCTLCAAAGLPWAVSDHRSHLHCSTTLAASVNLKNSSPTLSPLLLGARQ